MLSGFQTADIQAKFSHLSNQDSNIYMPYICLQAIFKKGTAFIWKTHVGMLFLIREKEILGWWGFMPEFFFPVFNYIPPFYQIRLM